MSPKKLDLALYRGRYLVILISVLFVLYCNTYLWFILPYREINLTWRSDDIWIVEEVGQSEDQAGFFEVGDIVLSIAGQSVSPKGIHWPVPRQRSYQITIQRNQQQIEGIVHFPTKPGRIAVDNRLPAGLLSLGLWAIGPMMLYFTKRDNLSAIHAGYIFLLGGCIVIGIQAFTGGVPGAWLSVPLIWIGFACLIYLGFLPLEKPLGNNARTVLRAIFAGAITIGCLALIKGVFFFSINEISFINLYRGGMVANFAALLALFAILLVRIYQSSTKAYERQQIAVLLLFVGLAVLPTALLTFIPRFAFDINIIPVPVSIVILTLFPLGYFYVIFRKGYIGLDILFSKIAILLSLVVGFISIYAVVIFALRRWLDLDIETIVTTSLTLAPVFLLIRRADSSIDSYIQRVLFGYEVVKSERDLPNILSRISSSPRVSTLRAIVESVTHDFNIPHALLVLTNAQGELIATAKVGDIGINIGEPVNVEKDGIAMIRRPIIRTTLQKGYQYPPLLTKHIWAEAIIPVFLRQEFIGYLALSRPRYGFFNIRHINFFIRLTDMIAIASEAIFLFEASRQWSLETFKAQELERKRVASEIHDSSVQTLAHVSRQLSPLSYELGNPEHRQIIQEQLQHLQKTIRELRGICVDLHPPGVDDGFIVMAGELASQFNRQYNLNVHLISELEDFDAHEMNYDTEIATHVYFILREALNNVVKHVPKREATVYMDCKNDSFRMTVADQGQSCFLGLAKISRTDLMRSHHIGVVNMYEWAESIGGQLEYLPNEPQGTKVVLEIPL